MADSIQTVAMISLHTSPLAQLGRTRDAGGMNAYIRGLATELARGGTRVDIFTRRTDSLTPEVQDVTEGVRLIQIEAGPVVPLPPGVLAPYVELFARRVARFAVAHRRRYDIVHTHYWLSALVGMALADAWDIPHVTMFHTLERLKAQRVEHARGSMSTLTAVPVAIPLADVADLTAIADMADVAEPFALAPAVPSAVPMDEHRVEGEARIAHAVDRIIVSTEHEREQVRRLYGLPPQRLPIIPCGVNLGAFTPTDAAGRAEARRRVGVPEGVPLLLSVGRLDPIKGMDLLLESLAEMRTPAHLVIVGGNPDGDPEVDRLHARADALGLAGRVTFPGAVAPPTLRTYYHAADALVVASRYESFGLVAAEALACGTPVVAAAVGGLPSIVRDGENGLLVRWRCPAAFAERLDELLGDDALRDRLREHARDSVLGLGWAPVGDRVRALYQAVLSEDRLMTACAGS